LLGIVTYKEPFLEAISAEYVVNLYETVFILKKFIGHAVPRVFRKRKSKDDP
jgi:hypothetical protein